MAEQQDLAEELETALRDNATLRATLQANAEETTRTVDELAEQKRWANTHFKTIGDMLDVLGIAHDGIQYEKVIDAVRKYQAKSSALAAELAEAKEACKAVHDWLCGTEHRTEGAEREMEAYALHLVRQVLTRPAPAPDKGEVERLREKFRTATDELLNRVEYGDWSTIADLRGIIDAALTPAPDAAEKPSRADALQAAIDNAGLDVSVCSECGRVVVCIPDGMPMCEKCATAEAGQKGGE